MEITFDLGCHSPRRDRHAHDTDVCSVHRSQLVVLRAAHRHYPHLRRYSPRTLDPYRRYNRRLDPVDTRSNRPRGRYRTRGYVERLRDVTATADCARAHQRTEGTGIRHWVFTTATTSTGSDPADWNAPEVVDSMTFTEATPLPTSLAIVDGSPAISYRDINSFDLKYAYYAP